MSLATRCTACGTIFRVVQDQLRVSEGWVRCGRCAEVFDAREQLFDLERDAPPPWPGRAVNAQPRHDAPRHQPRPTGQGSPRPSEPAVSQRDLDEETWELTRDEASVVSRPSSPPPSRRHVQPETQASLDRHSEPSPERAERSAKTTQRAPSPELPESEDTPPELAFALSSFGQDRREPFFGPSSLDSQLPDAEGASSRRPRPKADNSAASATVDPARGTPASSKGEVPASPATKTGDQAGGHARPTAPDESHPAAAAQQADDDVKVTIGAALPSFMKDTASSAPARSAAWRWVMLTGSTLLAILLAIQALLHHRDALAAQRPALRPLLKGLCATVGCKVNAWRHLEDLSVESSSLTLAGSGLHYKLQVQLRNKGAAEVALPWLDLSLTDTQGQLIARRMLSPLDFQVREATLAAHGELSLSLVFNASGQKVSGYTVEIFHP